MIHFTAVVTDVFERKLRKHSGGVGPEAKFSSVSDGWYIQLDGMISIWTGRDRPPFAADDKVIITVGKAK
jgi:hypothetical protein